jgi:hypothetical protein
MRRDPITLESEGKRLIERYKIIFKAFPIFFKFVKQLAKEAFWLYHASKRCNESTWIEVFSKHHKASSEDSNSRTDKLRCIKATFKELNVTLEEPKMRIPIISFSTWKGGDRDGNPFVVASFSNQSFLDQKQFVIQEYIEIAK